MIHVLMWHYEIASAKLSRCFSRERFRGDNIPTRVTSHVEVTNRVVGSTFLNANSGSVLSLGIRGEAVRHSHSWTVTNGVRR